MAKSTSSDAFISGSYSIPTFVTKSEQFDPMSNAAIVRKRTGRKPQYFVIDEETSEEYKVDASEAWTRLIDPFLAGAMSHDIIPALSKILKRDGWSSLFYDPLNCILEMKATSLLLEYQHDFECEKGTALQALRTLPETHDDWAIALLMAWQTSQYVDDFSLLKYDTNSLYPYLHSRRKGAAKFDCRYNPKELLTIIEIEFQDWLDSDDEEEQAEKRTNLKNAINDYLVITPLRQNDQEEINDLKERLAEMKTRANNLIHGILAEIMDELKNNKYNDKYLNKYIAEVEEYTKQLL